MGTDSFPSPLAASRLRPPVSSYEWSPPLGEGVHRAMGLGRPPGVWVVAGGGNEREEVEMELPQS